MPFNVGNVLLEMSSRVGIIYTSVTHNVNFRKAERDKKPLIKEAYKEPWLLHVLEIQHFNSQENSRTEIKGIRLLNGPNELLSPENILQVFIFHAKAFKKSIEMMQ